MIQELLPIVREAGQAILNVYGKEEVEVRRKEDRSPVTEADLASQRVICAGLARISAGVPVLSEESAEHAPYEERRRWEQFWLVDPLDGTKEFLKRNGQFTVNVALVRGGVPVAGVVLAPALDLLYYAEERRAYRVEASGEPELLSRAPTVGENLRVVGSLSHPTPELEAYVEEQRRRYREVEFVPMGSSLKICLVADGRADVYPRFGPTMEWDTAAAHAVANAAGRRVLEYGKREELRYNKRDLRNPWFVVEAATNVGPAR